MPKAETASHRPEAAMTAAPDNRHPSAVPQAIEESTLPESSMAADGGYRLDTPPRWREDESGGRGEVYPEVYQAQSILTY